tara:strand:- start:754 stop:1452 length:699 start_codon:yes stop_codon:yes gene_type:complete
MNNQNNFETYLFINQKKFILRVIHNTSFETIYSEEMLLNEDRFNFEILDRFLEKNIFKVEKTLKNFIKNIYIILDSEDFFSVKFSIKKNNNNNYIDTNTLIYPLTDLKNSFYSNFSDRKIIHILIENYLIDNKKYSSLPKNIKCNFFCLDVNFISLSNNFIDDLEYVLKGYHILINRILSSDYIVNFSNQIQKNIFTTASRVKSGYNENEVSLVNKSSKNKGFFERFFNFFN